MNKINKILKKSKRQNPLNIIYKNNKIIEQADIMWSYSYMCENIILQNMSKKRIQEFHPLS